MLYAARIFDVLMHKLGYDRYFVQGGDWGALVVRSMGVLFPDRVMALHTNMPMGRAPKDFDPSTLTPKEAQNLMKGAAFQKTGVAYQVHPLINHE